MGELGYSPHRSGEFGRVNQEHGVDRVMTVFGLGVSATQHVAEAPVLQDVLPVTPPEAAPEAPLPVPASGNLVE